MNPVPAEVDAKANPAKAKAPRWRRILIWGLLLAALLGTGLAVACYLSARHVSQAAAGRSYSLEQVPARPIAMVLGARAGVDGPSPFLAARLDLAVELFKAGRIKAILVSGNGGASGNNEPKVMQDYLVARGIPAAKIVQDGAGYDTYYSCVRANKVYGVKQLVILTQQYHLERAITICNGVGIDAIGVGDLSVKARFPMDYTKGQAREWLANLKMEWELFTKPDPQLDPYDPSLLQAAEN